MIQEIFESTGHLKSRWTEDVDKNDEIQDLQTMRKKRSCRSRVIIGGRSQPFSPYDSGWFTHVRKGGPMRSGELFGGCWKFVELWSLSNEICPSKVGIITVAGEEIVTTP